MKPLYFTPRELCWIVIAAIGWTVAIYGASRMGTVRREADFWKGFVTNAVITITYEKTNRHISVRGADMYRNRPTNY